MMDPMSPPSSASTCYYYDDGNISVNDNPDAAPTGCSACATAAWLDTLNFIRYMCT